MSFNRGRSRSQGRSHVQDVSNLAKEGNSEADIVNVAIKQLPAKIKERLEKLFEEGLLKENDLDLRSITVFASLNEGLQDRVMTHMENERIYVANARSKSGFLIATCDKAKTGCLDARGLGAIDPWRTALVAMATPKQKMIDLQPERDWIEKYDEGKVIKIKVNVENCKGELGQDEVTVELPLTETAAAVKAKLTALGVKSLPANRMKLHTEPVGFLKERFTFAFYNLADKVKLTLSGRKRAGTRFRRDHTVMPKRPKTQPAPGEAPAAAAANPLDALKNLTAPGGKMPALPTLPKLPSLPGLPGLPSMPSLGGTGPGLLPPGTGPAAGLGGMPGLPMGGKGGMVVPPPPGGMGAMGAVGKAGGMPGLPGMPGGMPGGMLGGK